MRRLQAGNDLRLALEAIDRGCGHRGIAGERVASDQFDRGRTSQHAMRGAPDLAHAAASKEHVESIAPEVVCATYFHSQAVDDTRRHVGEHDIRRIGQHEDRKELPDAQRRRRTDMDLLKVEERHERIRDHERDQCFARPRRNENREEHRPWHDAH